MKRILLVLAVVVVGTLGVVTAATAAGRGSVRLPALVAKSAQVSYSPAVAAADVNPSAPASVTVSDGTLEQVALTNARGERVEGSLNADRSAWTSTEPLGFGTAYTWSGTALGADKVPVPLQGGFETVKPGRTVRGVVNIGDGRTVGIAAPIEIQFNAHVDDRAAVERALSVQTSVPVEGAWGWLPDENGGSRVHWRPKTYWPAYTTVSVRAKLYGVDYGGGRFGAADVSSDFAIGRAQVVKADAQSFRMVVERDGRRVADYPASYGLTSDPERNTRSGVHVVTEKFTDKRMTSRQYGYDVMEKWAVRMSNNGEFIHANPASAAAQGSSNVTHGCVNLSTADAKAYYDTVLYGDPVEVTGTPVALSAKDGDVWDWTLSWSQWQELSAL
jgi:lipoprotein-anchoring transpeptidase ErfK/SrfK